MLLLPVARFAEFYIKTQVISSDPVIDGLWFCAFDMDLKEVYGCPHDVGRASNCSESGWTDAEILMRLMMPDILGISPDNSSFPKRGSRL